MDENILQRFSIADACLRCLTRIRVQLVICFCLFSRSLPENTEEGQTGLRGKILAQKFRKKLYVV